MPAQLQDVLNVPGSVPTCAAERVSLHAQQKQFIVPFKDARVLDRGDGAEAMLSSSLDSSLAGSESDSDDYEPGHTGFDELVKDIKKILGPTSGLDSEEVDVEELMGRIRDYKSVDAEWSRFAFADESYAYTRNGVDDINKKANLLILVWTPGKASAIHDHANAHCIVKVLKGTLRETLYDMPDGSHGQLNLKKVTDYTRDQTSYMSDTLGLHRMENPGTEYAISLHLYTPPYASKFGCHTYNYENGDSTKVSMCNLYSVNAKKNTQ